MTSFDLDQGASAAQAERHDRLRPAEFGSTAREDMDVVQPTLGGVPAIRHMARAHERADLGRHIQLRRQAPECDLLPVLQTPFLGQARPGISGFCDQ